MGFWNLFKTETGESDQGQLYQALCRQLPEHDEDGLIVVACVAGLMARVAYVDFKLDQAELAHIREVLKEWTDFDDALVESITQLSVDLIKELAGLENHLYAHQLKDILDKNTRFKLLESLFALAASDGSVENLESEEIRLICKGLALSDAHFLSARAKVAQHLKALR